MSIDSNSQNNASEKRQGLLSILVQQLGLPLLLILAGLVLEYHSGMFQSVEGLQPWVTIRRIASIALAAALLSFCLSAWSTMRIWFLMHRHFRETFALKASFMLSALLAVLTFSLISGLMPWSIGVAIGPIIFGQTLPLLTPPIEGYVLLLVLSLLLATLAFIAHAKWSGLKSEQQHRCEERGESVSLIEEGSKELRRIIRRSPSLTVYVERRLDSFFDLNPTRNEPKLWKDAALELYQMHNKSFEIERDQGWHQPPGCWVGRNRHTDDMIILYPVHSLVDNELRDLVNYIDRLPTRKNRRHVNITVITKEEQILAATKINGREIRFQTESSLIEQLLNLDDYRNEIRRRVEEQQLPDSNLSLQDVYVPSQFITTARNETSDVEPYLLHWLDAPDARQVVLLGEYGQGKSTTALLFTYHLLSQQGKIPERIPILIELRGAAPSGNINNTLGLLGAWAVSYDINPKLLNLLNEAGRLVLIFEGFDELSQVGDPTARYLHFSALWRFHTQRSKLLFTGRPNLFSGEDEIERALGLKTNTYGGEAHSEPLVLSFFTLEQIGEALRNYSPLAREQICGLASRNTTFRDLVARPSLLHIVATLWEQERLVEQIDRLNSAFVMDLFIRKSYRRPGRSQSASDDLTILTTLERVYFMHGIAAYMVVNNLPNQIEARLLDRVIDQLTDVIPRSISTSSAATSGETTIPLKDRIAQVPYGYEQVRSDVRTYGLLVNDPATIGTFRFAHKSFMEYLIAAVIADNIIRDGSWRTDLADAVIEVTDVSFEDVLRPSITVSADFLAEILAGRKETASIAIGNLSSQDELIQQETADQLLRTVFSSKWPFSKKTRFAVFLSALIASNNRRLLLVASVIMFALPLILIVFSLLLVIIPISENGATLNQIIQRDEWNELRILALVIPCLALLWMGGDIYFFMLALQCRSRLKLWHYLSVRLGTRIPVMHRVIGTYRFVDDRELPLIKHPSSLNETQS